MCVSVSVWPEDGVGRDSSHTGGTEPSTVSFINDLVKLWFPGICLSKLPQSVFHLKIWV